MTENVSVICSRCQKTIEGLRDPLWTAGFYEVSSGDWAKYANPGETILCDECMSADVRYQNDYSPFPRRDIIKKMTPAEKAIYDLTQDVERLGAHPLLTDVVVLLVRARGKLADWVDMQLAHTAPAQSGSQEKEQS